MTTLSIVYSDVPGFPAGSVVDHIVVQVSGQPEQSVPPGTASVDYSLPDGTYSASAFGADAAGTALGTPATTAFTVASPVTLSLPSSVSVSVSLSLPAAVTT